MYERILKQMRETIRTRHNLGDWKYLVQGQTVGGKQVIVVTKLSPTNKLVIITVYLE